MKNIVWVGLLAFGAALSFGCDKAEEVVDCAGVCERYRSCFDEDYDVPACVDECTSKADKEESYGDKVSACEACIDDKSCAEGTFECATKCVGIVP